MWCQGYTYIHAAGNDAEMSEVTTFIESLSAMATSQCMCVGAFYYKVHLLTQYYGVSNRNMYQLTRIHISLSIV